MPRGSPKRKRPDMGPYMRRYRAAKAAGLPPPGRSKAQRNYAAYEGSDNADAYTTAPEPDQETSSRELPAITVAELIATIDQNPIYAAMKRARTTLKYLLQPPPLKVDPLLVVAGQAGLGKTKMLKNMTTAASLHRGFDWEFCIASDAAELADIFWDYEQRNIRLVVFDDNDQILRSPKVQAIMKTACDLERREVEYPVREEPNAMLLGPINPNQRPRCFPVRFGVLWLTNQNILGVAQGYSGTAANIEAIGSRGEICDVRGEMVDKFRHLMCCGLCDPIITATGIPEEVRLRALLFINQHREYLRRMDLRGLVTAIKRVLDADTKEEMDELLGLLLWHKKLHHNIPGFNPLEIADAIRPGWQPSWASKLIAKE